MEDLWLKHAKRLYALASTGASYTTDRYDRERYEEIAGIAVEMVAAIGSVPVAAIEQLIGPFAGGYVTPKVDVRGAVFRDGKILLVRERTDGRWALPGGFAELGLSAAENIIKEIREEASLDVRVTGLFGIRHKAKAAYEPDAREFYKLFFACEVVGVSEAQRDEDILEWGFFASDRLPPLSAGKTIPDDITRAFAYASGIAPNPFFD